MATFTVTTTITGTANGRSIDISNTYTVDDIAHVIEEASEFGFPQLAATTAFDMLNKDTGNPRRGLFSENGPALFAFFVSNTGGAVRLGHQFGPSDVGYTLHMGGVPSLFFHSGTFDGQVNADAGPAIPDPTGNITHYTIMPVTAASVRAFALLKPVS